ncbi:MAG: 50S ribosomal protein L11 methyltransferase [Acidobacteria bacterium]|nr:50S ribosomal protein L11 methyltransferase [Acidobacteriota bacterium]
MMADEARMDAYTEALRRAVTPGSTVIDIGTGPGIFALLACRFGAGHVYAIDPSDAIIVAREAAAANGLADRITFIQGLSTEFTPPQPADVIISDLRGLLPFLGSHIPSIIDARSRLLKPGGAQIPLRDELWAGVVNAEETWNEYMAAWKLHGFDYRSATRIITNTTGWRIKDVKPGILAAQPQRWATMDYRTIENPNVSGEVAFTIERDGPAHGVLIWFDTMLADEIGFSNHPGSEKPAKVYGRSFFPWSEPVDLRKGDEVRLRIEARLVGQDYIYLWETTVNGKNIFKQSTFYGAPLSISMLKEERRLHPFIESTGTRRSFRAGAYGRRRDSRRDCQSTFRDLARSVPEMAGCNGPCRRPGEEIFGVVSTKEAKI